MSAPITPTALRWKYTGIDSETGKSISVEMVAASADEVKLAAANRGVLDPKISRIVEKTYGRNITSTTVMENFIKHLAGFLNSNMSEREAFQAAAREVPAKSKFGKLLAETLNALEYQRLDEALAANPKAWGDDLIRAVATGAGAGNLGDVLKLLVSQQKTKRTLRSKVRSAMRDPVIIFALTFALFIAAAVKFIPDALSVNEELGLDEVPASTQSVITIGDFFLNYWIIFFGFLSVASIGFYFILQNEDIRLKLAKQTLALPLFGPVIRLTEHSLLATQIGLGLAARAPNHQVLAWTAENTGNRWIRSKIWEAQRAVLNGSQNFAEALKSAVPAVPHEFATFADRSALEGKPESIWIQYGAELNELALAKVERVKQYVPLIAITIVMALMTWVLVAWVEPSLVPLKNLGELTRQQQ